VNRPAPTLSPDRLRALAADGAVDEVIVAAPDLLGRLVGGALDPAYFLDDVVPGGGWGACTYLFAADVDMDTDAGYAYDPWADGFGDLLLVPDLATLRRTPWRAASAVVIADARWRHDSGHPVRRAGSPVRVAPRTVLRGQLDRLAARGLVALAGTELEFLVFEESYPQAASNGYGGLTPATRFNVDYSLIGTAGLSPLADRIRRAMAAAGVAVESSRAEVHPGQYEIVFRYADALTACDNHLLYKTAAKNLAAEAGQALTFMAKYDGGEGNSCHVHLSLRATDGETVFAASPSPSSRPPDAPPDAPPHPAARDGVPGPTGTAGMSDLMASFLAGQLACLADFTLLFAPTVNAYKRLAPGGFAPVGVCWGRDNRTCALRVVGSGPSLRIEHRVPGGDVNPYLAVAGILAAGMHGIDRGLTPPPAVRGNAFADPSVPRLPASLADATRLWRSSALAREVFGADVVEHYAHAAETELESFAACVTDWERRRAFERL
jgi:glutamine synthetase